MEMFTLKLSFIFLLVLPSIFANDDDQGLQTYIIHLDPKAISPRFLTYNHWHKSFLPADSRLIYSYNEAISGFAARLTEQELADIRKRPGFLHAYPDRVVPLLTTHSPQFLGLDRYSAGLWKTSNFGKGVIVGVLDTGLSPDLPSFKDDGVVGPPPNKWKGGCDFPVCNNKLIGAKNFVSGFDSMRRGGVTSLDAAPDDTEGHGTHTASTAAGMFVENANVEGQANGTASGMAPYAHLAIYKICGDNGCASSDILAGMDQAISDGVDIMSLSLGGSSLPYYSDGIAIGAFAAMAKGIFVSCAGGNSGPSSGSLSNEAPWILTVGASTIDRSIRSTVKLGNGQQFDGESVHQPAGYSSPSLPLVFPGSRSSAASLCAPGSLPSTVRGKIVVCNEGQYSGLAKGKAVQTAGGAGMIIANAQVEGNIFAFADANVLPASTVSYNDGAKIKSYITSTSSPAASISFKGTILGKSITAPVVAYFSSRGPNQADPNILKPDIIGPGVSILAAWPFNIGSPGTKFNIISGTSMATPHLTGLAAVLKSVHPEWSPAAIKSAIMTTASITDNNGNQILDQNANTANFFAIGAGHVDPVAASNPGLIYDLSPADYIPYLCSLQYTDNQVGTIIGGSVQCSGYTPVTGSELNYPSFMVSVNIGDSVTVTRTVTNVGAAGSTYTVNVIAPAGADVVVDPQTITFSSVNEKAQFSVTFTGKDSGGFQYSEGYLTWSSSDHSVNSPIMVSAGASYRESM